MSWRAYLLCLAVAVAVAVAVAGCGDDSSSAPPDRPPYLVEVKVPKAAGGGPSLRVGAQVRIAQVGVGKVTAVDADGKQIKATLKVRHTFEPVSPDARAMIRRKVFGEGSYLELREPKGTPDSAAQGPTPGG